jgi:hypothetical protein
MAEEKKTWKKMLDGADDGLGAGPKLGWSGKSGSVVRSTCGRRQQLELFR